MKEIPILFSRDMVRAILEGRKTITRRVIKPQPFQMNERRFQTHKGSMLYDYNSFIKKMLSRCPFGQTGDKLWVRETWCPTGHPGTYLYRADNHCEVAQWKPSIHMPRCASRIIPEIVNIRVERLQDITAEECIREGIYRSDLPTIEERADYDRWQFSQLWDSINLKRGYGWAVNPWVWVIEFKLVKIKEVA